MNLRKHIEENFAGNRAAFARSINKLPEQVRRWEGMACIWYEGNVYCPKTDDVPDSFFEISDDSSVFKEQP